MAEQKLAQPGGPAGADDEEPPGQGVERAAVADPALAADPPHRLDHVVGGQARRLVDQKERVHGQTVAGPLARYSRR